MFRRLLHFLKGNRYEGEAWLGQYLRAQYGPFLPKPYHQSESFYQAVIATAAPYAASVPKALDVGCATGRLVFEWEKLGVSRSVGIDSSKTFIDFCNALTQGDSSIPYTPLSATRTEFICGDILTHQLPEGSYDFISCVNLVDRVPDPHALIRRMQSLLKGGGVLLLVDPYDWELSPAPARLHVQDMKELLPSDIWKVEQETKNIAYVTPVGVNQERTYSCHLLIVRKLA